MKTASIYIILILLFGQHGFTQQSEAGDKEILRIIDNYSKSVIGRDSVTFYSLFNEEGVIWCGAVTERSQQRVIAKKGAIEAGNSYFTGSYKGFMRGLFRYKSTEDKFDNIKIVEDGTVATVTMDYSFWADNKMTNWGSKYLTLIKRDGKWKIVSVIYSLDFVEYFLQPTLQQRQKIINHN